MCSSVRLNGEEKDDGDRSARANGQVFGEIIGARLINYIGDPHDGGSRFNLVDDHSVFSIVGGV